MGVDRYRVCELYAAGPDAEGSGSGYRVGDRLVLTARHVIAPALAGAGGQVLVRPADVSGWLPARVEWHDADADAALIGIEEENWQAPGGESVLRWGELVGSDPVLCAAVGFPWASARPDLRRDTAHLYGQLAPLGQLRQGRLDLDVASASPSAREGGSPWAGMSGAGVIADNHLVGVITIDPARYQDRLVAVPASSLLANPEFRAQLKTHKVAGEAELVGGGWYLQLPRGRTVGLSPAYLPVNRRFRPALSTLLRPEHGLVPFLGREAVLDQVTSWCQDPADRPLMLVIGGGGSGKTRLGREACVRMLVSGWDAGLADDQRRDGTPLTRLQRRTLLVVDDADLRTGLISALVEYIGEDYGGPQVGLLLLARAAGDWWDHLVLENGLDNAYTILDLDRHPLPPADRAEHFRYASAAFAAYGGSGARPTDPPSAAELADPTYAEPLLIHIAALLRTVEMPATPLPGLGGDTVLDDDITAAQPGSPVRQRLLRRLCNQERARWYQLGDHLPFNQELPLADQVVALATLTAADDQACAISLLAAVPNQAEVTRIGVEALVVWAHRLYAGPGYWNPLRPDLLAEQHLADTAQLSSLATAAIQQATGRREAGLLTQLLAELTRGAPNQPAVLTALSEVLAAELPAIVELALTTDHSGLADLASLALQLAPQPGLAARLADQMPNYSVRLAALAVTLSSQQVAVYRQAATDGQQDSTGRLAGSLHNLSAGLIGVGRAEEALAASEEATVIYRELAVARPDLYREGLASSLNTLAVALPIVGRAEEALAANVEATVIYAELAAARPDAYRPGLASSLDTLANRLDALGRAEEALAASEEATVIYAELAVARPDAYRPGLAGSLDTLAKRLGDLGRAEEALAASEEATVIYAELAAARPDAYRHGLAGSLDTLANRLASLGRAEEALAAIEEATVIYRELAAARPDAYREGLADLLNTLAIRLGDLGRMEEALAAIEEATVIYRELAAARPDAYRKGLADLLNTLSNRLAGLGRAEEALAAIEEAVTIRRELAAAHPDVHRPGLALSVGNLAARLGAMDRTEEALAASEEATGLYRELYAARPDAYRPDLARSVSNQGGFLLLLDRDEDGLAAIEEATGFYRELAAARPDAYWPGLAMSLNNLAAGLGGLGRAEEALAASMEATDIYRELAAARPDAYWPSLAIALQNLAVRLSRLGRAEEALAASVEATGIYRELAARWPDAYRHKLEQSLQFATRFEHG